MKKKTDLLIELAKFFKKELEPTIIEYEKERKANILPYFFIKTLYLGFALSFICGFCGLGFLMSIGFIMIAASVICLFLHKFLSKNKSTRIIEMDYEMMIKRQLMPKFLSLFDCGLKWIKYSDMSSLSEWNSKVEELKIFPNHDFITFDDIIIGHELNVPIDIIETKFGLDLRKCIKFLANKNCLIILFVIFSIFPILLQIPIIFLHMSGNVLVMILLALVILTSPFFLVIIAFTYLKIKFKHSRNLIIQFKISKPIKGHTIVFEKNHIFIDKAKFERVILENVNFENKYDTYSSNQIEARYLLTTAFMARFEDMKTAFTAKKIRAEFKDDKLSIFIEVDKDMFQMGNITKETSFKTFTTMLDEIYSVLSLSKQLNLDSETRL